MLTCLLLSSSGYYDDVNHTSDVSNPKFVAGICMRLSRAKEQFVFLHWALGMPVSKTFNKVEKCSSKSRLISLYFAVVASHCIQVPSKLGRRNIGGWLPPSKKSACTAQKSCFYRHISLLAQVLLCTCTGTNIEATWRSTKLWWFFGIGWYPTLLALIMSYDPLSIGCLYYMQVWCNTHIHFVCHFHLLQKW